MVQINFALREVNVKLVYYGPGRCGKTTNLQIIHAKAPKGSIGEMMSIATETDRTLFFDFLPLDLGKVAGMNTKFQLYTVPGQVYYKATRKLVLQGADGVVFVADSQRKMMEENQQSLLDLEENLRENGLDINTIPLVFQWNKRDLPNIVAVDELNSTLNRWNAPHFEAVAVNGDGVFPTLKALASLVIKKLNQEHGFAGADAVKAAPSAVKPAAPAPAAAVKPAATPAIKPVTPAATINPAAAKELAVELSAGIGAPPSSAPSAAHGNKSPSKEVAAAPTSPKKPPPAAAAKPPAMAAQPAAQKSPAPAAPTASGEPQAETTVRAAPSAVDPSLRDKWREEAEKKKRERLQRIKEGSQKPISTGKGETIAAAIGVALVILAAVAAIVYFVFWRKP